MLFLWLLTFHYINSYQPFIIKHKNRAQNIYLWEHGKSILTLLYDTVTLFPIIFSKLEFWIHDSPMSLFGNSLYGFIQQSQVWEVDSFLIHEVNDQIIQNIHKFLINAYVCLPLLGLRSLMCLPPRQMSKERKLEECG